MVKANLPKPKWFDNKIEEKICSFEEFKNIIAMFKCFFESKEEYIQWIKRQCKIYGTTKEQNYMLKDIIDDERKSDKNNGRN